MVKRTLLYAVVMLILLALAVSAGQWGKSTALLEQQAAELSNWIQQQETAAKTGQGAGTVLKHQGDSLLSWSNTNIIPSVRDLKEIAGRSGSGIIRLPHGYFWLRSESSGNGQESTLIPVQYALNFNQLAIKNPTPIRADIQFSATDKTNFPVVVNGKEIGWLSDAPLQGVSWMEILTLLSWLLAFVVFLGLLNLSGQAIREKTGYAFGSGFVALVACALLYLNIKTGFTAEHFGQFPLFQPTFHDSSLIGRSVGDWLLNSMVLVFMMGHFHHIPQSQRSVKSKGLATSLLTLNYLAAMLSVGIGAEAIRQLIFKSHQRFDFDRILLLGIHGFLALTGVVAFMVGLFLFSHSMAKGAQSLSLTRNNRYLSIGLATLLFSILLVITGKDVGQVIWLASIGLVLGLMLDTMVHWQGNSFGWGIFWLVLFSFFASLQLYQNSTLRDRQTREQYASALAQDRDTVLAEKLFPELVSQLQRDSVALGKMLKPWPFKAEALEIRDYINRTIFQQNYIFQHYRLSVYAFDKENQPILLGQTLGYEQVVLGNWATAKPLSPNSHIRFGYDTEESPRYLVQLGVHRMDDPTQPANIYLFFDLKYPAPSRAFSHLFFNSPLKDLQHLPEYDFSITKNGRLKVDQGLVNMSFLGQNLQAGATAEFVNNQHIDAVAKSTDNQTVAAVGRNSGTWLNQVYLFSILFTIASLCLIMLALVNTWVKFLPGEYDFRLKAGGSLARRIHFWNVTLLAIAFGIVGYLTYRQFTRSAHETERNDYDFRVTAILSNLKAQALDATISDDSLRRSLPISVSNMTSSLGIDAHFFDAGGSLIFSTQDELVRLGVLPAKMNPTALNELRKNIAGRYTALEKSAGLSYQTQYRTLQNAEGKTLGYLAVPFVETQGNSSMEVSNFIGMLASLYVFLLLVAFGVTYLLARSVIRPVSMLTEKVQVLRLEDKNEPLDYVGDPEDEISQLIGQYNTMVDKLESSKTQLVKLEREGAWREMARQVAHDIKNPLTTMKLSMQQLERLSGSPEQAAAYLRKAITRLIEQIDSLAQIASEFSMFANLDIKTKNDVVINEVVESVHDLFSEQKHVNLSLSLPEERFHILGDKNHLIRVFNNLVINAIQAIPSDRQGEIKVSLSRKGNQSVIQISDNGGGIPPEIRERVFEPNFTTKTSGSGLGLAICKKIIEAHDGNIRFETRDNEGTDFFVEVPVVAVD
jgi:two-component system nitrogen regulation sensor histidine kinase NtrY